MSQPEYDESSDIFSHPDLIALELQHEDPESTRMMNEVMMLDQALLHGALNERDEAQAVLNELNGRWKSHLNEQMKVVGTIYAEVDGFMEQDYLEKMLLFFRGFVLQRDSHRDDPRLHVRYLVGTHADTDVEEEALLTVDASAKVAFPNLISVEKMSHMAAGLMDDIDEVLTAEDVSFDDILHGLEQIEFARNIALDDMHGAYSFLAHYLNHAMSMNDMLAVTAEVEGVVYQAGASPTPYEAEGSYTVTSPLFFFFIHDENFVELCLIGNTVHRGYSRRTSDPVEMILPLGALKRANPVSSQH